MRYYDLTLQKTIAEKVCNIAMFQSHGYFALEMIFQLFQRWFVKVTASRFCSLRFLPIQTSQNKGSSLPIILMVNEMQ